MTHTRAVPRSSPVPATTTAAPRRGGAFGGVALVARTITGAVLLLVGAAMLVLPGPGLLVIVAGLSVLAIDYVWARRLRTHATERLAATGRTIRRKMINHRGPPHDFDRDCDGAADTDDQDVRDRDPRRGVECPMSEVR